ncbi:MAG TPA: aspartate ammonia-lyase [Methylomirabilota bacterium]|nr:aspartate ammonia-lyase [Methylomirabilota bacterium]
MPRIEHDFLGNREIPDDVYYGVQTLRATENFPISGVLLRRFPEFVNALAYVKKAAALANAELGVLPKPQKDAIVAACDEILAGKLHDEFVVDMIQGGAGTSTNMNANEVIANRGLELMGKKKSEYQHLHPNDHVNCSQSTNDAYPTAIKLAVVMLLKGTVEALRHLADAFAAKEREFADVIKMGRTEEQDAVPMTLGQEFGAYAVMIREATARLQEAGQHMCGINMGATAIGTGINSPAGYAELVTRRLAEVSGIPVVKADNLIEATQDAGEYVEMSATLKRAAVQLSKIARDLRLMSSGPRCGIGEIKLPPLQPGSSIMPGKVNPVMPEVVGQVCYEIIGSDVTVTMAAEAGVLELNMAEPIMAFNLFKSLMFLRNVSRAFADFCVKGIQADRERSRQLVQNSIGIVTALNPAIGYERSAAVAREALDDALSPEKMTSPRRVAAAEPKRG